MNWFKDLKKIVVDIVVDTIKYAIHSFIDYIFCKKYACAYE